MVHRRLPVTVVGGCRGALRELYDGLARARGCPGSRNGTVAVG